MSGTVDPASARLRSAPIVKMGRYHVLSRLGQGGMGTVYEAYDPELARKIALKVLHSSNDTSFEPARQERNRARLLREAKSLARLSHPNVVTIYDVGLLDNRAVYLAMEFIVGQSLRSVFAGEQLTWQERLNVLLQAGEGLAAAHEAGLIHRDIKPENIMVRPDGQAVVLDFGLAKDTGALDEFSEQDRDDANDKSGAHPNSPSAVTASYWTAPSEQLTQHGTLMGTPAYMAPEQIRGQTCDVAGDVFAFSCVLFEALNDALPFPAEPLAVRLAAITKSRLKWSAQVPAWLRMIVSRGLEVDPQRRSPSVRSFVEEIRVAVARQAAWRKVGPRLLVGILGAAMTSAWFFAPAKLPDPECRDPALLLHHVWNPATRDAVEEGFAHGAPSLSAELWEHCSKALDSWAARWIEQSRLLCPERRQELGLDPLEASIREQARACLNECKAEVTTILELWEKPTFQQILEAPKTVQSLSIPQDCLDRTKLALRAPLPSDPGKRREIQDLQAQLIRSKILVDQAKYEAARMELNRLHDQIQWTGSIGLHAQFLAIESSIIIEENNKIGISPRNLQIAKLMAIAANRGTLAAEIASELWFTQVYTKNQRSWSTDLLREIQANSVRANHDHRLTRDFRRLQAISAAMHGELAQAMQFFYSALPTDLSSIEAAQIFDDLSNTAQMMGNSEIANFYTVRALHIRANLLGKWHPDTLFTNRKRVTWFDQSNQPLEALAQSLFNLKNCANAGLAQDACIEHTAGYVALLVRYGSYAQAQHVLSLSDEIEQQIGHRSTKLQPWVASRLAALHFRRGRFESSSLLSDAGLAKLRAEKTFHPGALAAALRICVLAARVNGKLDAARQYFSEYRTLLESPSDFREAEYPFYLQQKSYLELVEGNHITALASFEQALLAAYNLSRPRIELANHHLDFAKALLAYGDLSLALYHATLALDLQSSVDGLVPHLNVDFHQTIAAICIAQERWAEALEQLDLAEHLFDPAEVLSNRLAPIYFLQAQAWWSWDTTAKGRKKARLLAEQARRHYLDWDAGAGHELAGVNVWLKRHPIP